LVKRVTAAVAAALSSLIVMGPALAHVTVQPSEAVAESFETFVVQVPNERDDAATVKIEVRFPQEFAFVSFQPKPGWRRDVEMVEFDEPLEAEGEEITEGVGTVTWSGGSIDPGEFETFAFSAGPVPNGEMSFPAVQTYDSGEVVRWTGPPDAEEPAALVTGIDLGAGGEGELSVLSDLQSGHGAGGESPEGSASGEEDDDDSNMGVMLGAAGIGIGAVALLVSLRRPRR
jgi:uncharacterized protein YcnI